jgi:multiple sugar transport system permease protein
MLLPFLGGTALLVALPALISVALAFTSYDALSPPEFAGLQNFRSLASDKLTPVSIGNSLVFVVLAVPLRILGAFSLALLLNRERRGVGAYRAAVYLPTVIPDVAYALIWLWIFNPLFGPINIVLGELGLGTPAWLVDAETAKYPFVVMSLFQIGEGFVVMLAALKGLSRDYYDAGAVDGAGTLGLFRFLTLPMLMPWLVLLTVRDVIVSFQYTFTPALVMTGGDPYYSTMFLPLMIFEEAFDRFRFGLGSALMLGMFLVTGALIVGLFLFFRMRGYTGET